MTVGKNIRRVRQNKKLTQKQLGDLCDPQIAESTIRRYELGKLNPKIETIQKIATALDVPLHEFFKSEEMDGSVVIDIREIQGQDIEKYLDALFKRPFSEQAKKTTIQTDTDVIAEYVNELGEFLYYNPKHKELFDASMEVKPTDVELAKQMLDRINGKKTE